MAAIRSHLVRAAALLACLGASAIPATTAGAATSRNAATSHNATAVSVRACGRGEVQEYPYFDVRAHGATCAVAQHLIRRLLCTNAKGHCAPGSHWHTEGRIYVGHWTSPAGWHCQAHIPPAVSQDGRPFGSELCRRASAWVSSKSYG
jgi:hypothetical protein